MCAPQKAPPLRRAIASARAGVTPLVRPRPQRERAAMDHVLCAGATVLLNPALHDQQDGYYTRWLLERRRERGAPTVDVVVSA